MKSIRQCNARYDLDLDLDTRRGVPDFDALGAFEMPSLRFASCRAHVQPAGTFRRQAPSQTELLKFRGGEDEGVEKRADACRDGGALTSIFPHKPIFNIGEEIGNADRIREASG